jgi:hypothetical protein
LLLMKEQGCLKAAILQFDCDFNDWEHYEEVSRPYVIKDYLRLHPPYANNKVLPVKKALLAGQPVIIGMHLTASFHRIGSDGWYRPTDEDRQTDLAKVVSERRYSGHAMTVVGYDDKRGRHGAVQIINSWGSGWADGGFCWVEYADFNRFVAQSFSMIGQALYKETLAGHFLLETEKGARMRGKFDPDRMCYRLAEKHPAGTRFRIYLKNEKPVYLYAFGFDQTARTFDVFPHQPDVSPFIPYDKAHVPIPDDDHFIEIDAVQQRNDLCVLYSVKELPVAKLREQLEARGRQILDGHIPLRSSVTELLDKLGYSAAPEDQTNFLGDDFSFQAKRATEVCVPVILEFGS